MAFENFSISGVGHPVPAPLPNATDYYVAESGSDDNDGLSPQTPFRTLQKALEHNVERNVYVDGGTYSSTNWKVNNFPKAYQIYGNANDIPVIDGNNTTGCFSPGNESGSYTFPMAISNFRMINGKRSDWAGGGIGNCKNTSAYYIVFENCVSQGGGAMGQMYDNAHGYAIGCSAYNCRCTQYQGGGFSYVKTYDCLASGCSDNNSNLPGGGFAYCYSENCSAIDCNVGNTKGGGFYGSNRNHTAINCYAISCSANGDGAGFSYLDAYDCYAEGCYTKAEGGAFHQSSANNCSAMACSAERRGAAMATTYATDCLISSCRYIGNNSTYDIPIYSTGLIGCRVYDIYQNTTAGNVYQQQNANYKTRDTLFENCFGRINLNNPEPSGISAVSCSAYDFLMNVAGGTTGYGRGMYFRDCISPTIHGENNSSKRGSGYNCTYINCSASNCVANTQSYDAEFINCSAHQSIANGCQSSKFIGCIQTGPSSVQYSGITRDTARGTTFDRCYANGEAILAKEYGYNCTFYDCSAARLSARDNRVQNSIISEFNGTVEPIASNNVVINDDSVFVDAPNGDLHLVRDSRTVQKATGNNIPSADADGKPYSGFPSVGAYEYVYTEADPPSPTSTPTPGMQEQKQIEVALATTPYEKAVEIHYTTDGSLPTKNSTLYTGPFMVTSFNLVLRAVAWCQELQMYGPVMRAEYDYYSGQLVYYIDGDNGDDINHNGTSWADACKTLVYATRGTTGGRMLYARGHLEATGYTLPTGCNLIGDANDRPIIDGKNQKCCLDIPSGLVYNAILENGFVPSDATYQGGGVTGPAYVYGTDFKNCKKANVYGASKDVAHAYWGAGIGGYLSGCLISGCGGTDTTNNPLVCNASGNEVKIIDCHHRYMVDNPNTNWNSLLDWNNVEVKNFNGYAGFEYCKIDGLKMEGGNIKRAMERSHVKNAVIGPSTVSDGNISLISYTSADNCIVSGINYTNNSSQTKSVFDHSLATNCTVVGTHFAVNTGNNYRVAGESTLNNTLLYDNMGVLYNTTSNYSVSADNDPFKNYAAADLHLKAGTLCTDGGSTSLLRTSADLDGVEWKDPPSVGAYQYLPSLSISPAGGRYAMPLEVTMTAEGMDEIRYTLDGTDPTTDSTLYTGPFEVNTDTTITVKAKAWKDGVSTDTESMTYRNVDYRPLIYVDINATGNDDGSSWEDAFSGANGITKAMNALEDGTTVFVKAGTYTGNHSFEYDNVTISAVEDGVVLDGGQNGRCLDIDGDNCKVFGVEIRNGKITNGQNGGGINCASSPVEIENCLFSCCSGETNTGGVAVANGIVRNSTFTHCGAANGTNDVGITIYTSSYNCSFVDNYVGNTNGYAARNGYVEGCFASGNYTYGSGFIAGSSGVNCLLYKNRTDRGILCGGATAINCTVVECTGNYFNHDGSTRAYNILGTNNSFSYVDGVLMNSITANNVTLSSYFVDPDSHDFHLCATSPAIGYGSTQYLFTSADKDGNPWAEPPAVGCYEYTEVPPTSTFGLPNKLMPFGK